MTVTTPKASATGAKSELLGEVDPEGSNPVLTHRSTWTHRRLAVGVAMVTLVLLTFLVPVTTYVTLKVTRLTERVNQLEKMADMSQEKAHRATHDMEGYLKNILNKNEPISEEDYLDEFDDDYVEIDDQQAEESREVVVGVGRTRRRADKKKGQSVVCQLKANTKTKKLSFEASIPKDKKTCSATINKYIAARVEKKIPMTAIHLKANINVNASINDSLDKNPDKFFPMPEKHGSLNKLGFLPNDNQMAFWEQADWSINSKTKKTYVFNQDKGTVKIKKTGLYLIYAQVHFHETRAYLSYHVKRHGSVDDTVFTCKTNVLPLAITPGTNMTTSQGALSQSCSLSGTVRMIKGDMLSIQQSGTPLGNLLTTGDVTYWGLIQLFAE